MPTEKPNPGIGALLHAPPHPAERERDRYLRALQQLAADPRITVAEHIGEAPWLAEILREVKRKPTP